MVTKSEETAFWLLKVLIEKILPEYYTPTMKGLLTDIDVLAELVKYECFNAVNCLMINMIYKLHH